MAFQTEFLFRRISDFWSFFEDREDVKNIWDAYLRKAQALNSLLLQADLSKSLLTIPIIDRNDLEYFIFDKLTRRTDLETNNGPFYAFEVEDEIFFIRNFNEKIDDTNTNRVLTSSEFFELSAVEDKTILNFFRGVDPIRIGETVWVRGSDSVTGNGTIFTTKVSVDDIVQGQNLQFFKVLDVVSDTELTIQGPTVFGENVGAGDGATVLFQLAATENVITSSVDIFFDGDAVDSSQFTVTAAGAVTFTTAPLATVAAITVNYHLGYTGPSATNRRTVRESIPKRLFSTAVYRDRRSVFTNFGTQIGLDKPTSFQYLNEVRGLYFARFKGPTIFDFDLGSGILIGLPFTEQRRVDQVGDDTVVAGADLIEIPDPLDITVTAGQEFTQDFNLLTDGVETKDFINDPEFFDLEPLNTDPGKFFTFFIVVKGTFAVFVAEQTGQPIDYSTLKRFKLDIKPSYTNCRVLTDIDFIKSNLNLFIGAVGVTSALDAAATLEFNCVNFSIIPEFLTANSLADEAAAVVACPMDPDSIGLFENGLIEESVLGVPGATILTF